MTAKWLRTGLTAIAVAASLALPVAPASGEPDTPEALEPQALAGTSPTGKWFVQFGEEPTIEGGSASAIDRQHKDFRRALSADVNVTASFSNVWNGVTVDADDDALADIASAPGVTAVFPVLEIERPELSSLEGEATPDAAHAADMTGASYARDELGMTGKGIKIGIIDSGVDIDHPAFGGSGDPEANHVFPTKKVVAGWDFVGDDYNGSPSSQAYNPVPEPDSVPDDCSGNGHGTHIAGVAAGNDEAADFKGVAPDALIGAYRVFGCSGGTQADVMLAAMERAASDGMDVVNVSIGARFQTWPNYPTAVAVDSMAKSGIVVTCSQGNAGASGVFSGSAPAAAREALAVGSVDNSVYRASVFRRADGGNVAYSHVSGTPQPPEEGTLELAAYPEGMKTGAVDLDGTPFTGKAVLVSRGATPFGDKVKAAQYDGAEAVIIYNSAAGTFSADASDEEDLEIPAVAISRDDGRALEELVAAGPTSIAWVAEPVEVDNPSGGAVSPASSYGLAADLSVKPDVLAPGGAVHSAFPLEAPGAREGYATFSGTSVASSHVAGASALLLQSNPSMTPASVRTVMLNTAAPLDASASSIPAGAAKEPIHRQGAGLIDVSEAIAQAASFAPVGSGELASTVTPSKIAFGDTDSNDPVTLTILNRSSREVTYTLSGDTSPAGTWGPNRSPKIVAGLDTKVTLSAERVTVPANSSRTVEVSVDVPATYEDYSSGTAVRTDLPAPTFYGGYVVLTGSNGHVQRVPFAGLNADYESLDFTRSQWTNGDAYSPQELAAYDLDADDELYRQPSLGVVDYCSEELIRGIDCADPLAEYDQVTEDDHVYTMTGHDFPRVLMHIENPVSSLDVRVYHANDDGSKGEPAGDYNYAYRSDGRGVDTDVSTFSWDGKIRSSQSDEDAAPAPDGRYVLEARVTKGLGAAQDGRNTEVYTSNAFVVSRTDMSGARTVSMYSTWLAESLIQELVVPAGDVLVGDWNGDGIDTLAIRSGNTYTPIGGQSFVYGRDSDEALVGDWNGDGKDTIAVRRGNAIHVKNSLSGGNADRSYIYGVSSDRALVGDWNGDGKDTVAVIRGNRVFVKNSLSGGTADIDYRYGQAADIHIAGDWDGDSKDTISVRRGNLYYLNNALDGGQASEVNEFGAESDSVIYGDWEGDGITTPATVSG
ncbi:MAG: S8 family serine peptidase [Actinomycetaceae bacterium]|nr:S8 family serine peptidase [Actinomycetaceae bacterium]